MAGEEEDDGDPWDDWTPEEQTAADVIKTHEERAAAAAALQGTEDSDDDSDDWQPTEQQAKDAGDAATSAGPASRQEPGGEDEDDEWAPAQQGAADVKETEKEALAALLRPSPVVDHRSRKYESKKEADAAGKLLAELKRPPTMEEAKAQIPRGPDVDTDNLPAPQYLNMSQEEGMELVGRGASVNIHVNHGRTPLHKAVEHAYPLLAKAICDAGGEPDIRDNYGETPLLMMAHSLTWNEDVPRNRRSETIQMLLSCGADVHAVNPRGRTALHLACTENDHMAIETLIEGMASVDARDLAGFTPLMWAAGRNAVESVKMLLDYEADLHISANRGQSATTFALTNGCSAVVDVLEKHRALLDLEEAKRIKERGEKKDEDMDAIDTTLQLPRPEWACQKEAPKELEPFSSRKVYMQAKPDRRSNVYT